MFQIDILKRYNTIKWKDSLPKRCTDHFSSFFQPILYVYYYVCWM